MKYLNKFDTRSDYEASASTLEIPNVAYITATTEVIYNATVKTYIVFADPVVEQKCATLYGDGVGCTEEDLAAVSALSASDWSGTNITSFDELQYFSGLTSITDNAFYECSGLTSVTIPDTVTEIKQGAFYNTSLPSVVIPSGVTSIWYSVFANCSGLTSVNIPASATIGQYAFANCSSLSSITFEGTTLPQYLYNDTFTNLPTTGNITVPVGSESNFYSFAQGLGANWTVNNQAPPAPPVQYVQFADPVVSGVCVSNWSSDGTGCTEADLGAVTEMSSSVWSAATTMTTFDEFQYFTGLTSIASKTFTNKNSLTSVVIPSGVTSIGERAFYACYALTSVTIGNSVVTINDKVFYNCSGLTSVTIPNSVRTITRECFRGCSSLSDITFEATTPPSSIGQWAFYGIASTGNITVPVGSESNYFSLAQSIGANWTVNNQSPA